MPYQNYIEYIYYKKLRFIDVKLLQGTLNRYNEFSIIFGL